MGPPPAFLCLVPAWGVPVPSVQGVSRPLCHVTCVKLIKGEVEVTRRREADVEASDRTNVG